MLMTKIEARVMSFIFESSLFKDVQGLFFFLLDIKLNIGDG